ncbi:MAG: class I SAM-dependent methyltransferase [Myxococcota bacterium]
MNASGSFRGPAFVPWVDSRILEDSPDFLVVDKPSGIPTHGGDAALGDDVVTRLAQRLEACGRDAYLGVHQRLDLGTSGVLAFVRQRELSGAVQRAFESGAVKKRYIAGVHIAASSPLARRDELVLEHRIESTGKLQRVSPRGKPCRARCRVLDRRAERALVELLPETGRTHQLRVQLAAIDASIAGDRDYGGVRAQRLLLHAESLELLSRRFRAPVPPLFQRWLEARENELGSSAEIEQKLADAASRRYPLLERTEAFRWVNAAADYLFGVEIDLYAGYATLALSADEAIARRDELADLVHAAGALGVYLKLRARTDLRRADHSELAPTTAHRGDTAPSPLPVREGPLQIEIQLGDGLSTGLFLDQRDNRARVQAAAAGRRVLNLFSYTCSFSVAAALGGAARVTSVDLSRRALRRGEQNFRLNALDPTHHAFVCEDVLRYLTRAVERLERAQTHSRSRSSDLVDSNTFDLIILDPPSFSTAGKGKTLSVDRDYARLVALCLELLTARGQLLAVTNHRKTSAPALRRIVLAEAERASRPVESAKLLASGHDCPDGPDGPHPSKSVWLRLS